MESGGSAIHFLAAGLAPESEIGHGISDISCKVYGVLDVLGCVNSWLGSLALRDIFSLIYPTPFK